MPLSFRIEATLADGLYSSFCLAVGKTADDRCSHVIKRNWLSRIKTDLDTLGVKYGLDRRRRRPYIRGDSVHCLWLDFESSVSAVHHVERSRSHLSENTHLAVWTDGSRHGDLS